MKISAISDVHVKSPGDEADKLLMSFLEHPKVLDSDYILLLGDIFDLMCGPHQEYIDSYKHIFKSMTDLQKKGKKLFFIEGNHDVHLEKLFKKIWPLDEVVISQDPIIEMIDGKKYYFSHGDEHEVNNLSYQRYKNIIMSTPLKFVADYVMPYSVLNFVGEKASKMSRKKGSKKFDAEAVRAEFRLGVFETTRGQFDFVIGGHSHVQDKYTIPGSNSIYLNNGYALNVKTFIHIDDHKSAFISLT